MTRKHTRRGALAVAAGGAVATTTLPAIAAISSPAHDPVVEAARELRSLCEEHHRLDVEHTRLFQTLPAHLKGPLRGIDWEVHYVAAVVQNHRDDLRAVDRAVVDLRNFIGLHRERELAEKERGMPELDRRMDAVCDRRDAVERKVVNTPAKSLAGAMAQLALAYSYNKAFTGSKNKVDRELAEQIKRLLYSAVAVVESAAGVRRADLIGAGYVPGGLDPHTSGTPQVQEVGAV